MKDENRELDSPTGNNKKKLDVDTK